MSTRVAKALHLLQKDVTHVGKAPGTTKGDSDEHVAEVARKQSRGLFTANFDMVMTAADLGCRFIWYDGRQSLTLFETARLVFRRWEEWERLMARPDAECLRATKTTTSLLSFAEGRNLAQEKFERAQKARARAVRARRRVHPGATGPLSFPEANL